MSCSYCPSSTSGDLLATASGDGTVKLWDFRQACCTLTFAEHRQPGIAQDILVLYGLTSIYYVHCMYSVGL